MLKGDFTFTNFKSNLYLLLIPIVAALCFIGLIALYSSSQHVEGSFFQKVIGKQLLRMILGLFIAIGVFFVQKRLVYDMAYFMYSFGVFLLLLPFILGFSSAGTSRWLMFGGANFQPSEIMKIFVVIVIAKYLSATRIPISDFKIFIIPFLLLLLPMLIVLKQPDLGTSMIFLSIIFPMLFWAGVRIFHIFIIIAPIISILTAFNFYTFFIWVILLIIVLYLVKQKNIIMIVLGIFNLSLGFLTPILWNGLKTYQQNRILTLFNVNVDPQGAGYQVIQSQIAIGSGGLFGKGFGHGTQTQLKFLPEQHNDFIFSVIGEEYGFAGVLTVLALFLILIFICIYSASHLKDKFSSLVVIGLSSIILFHVVINVAMTIGLMPVTGLPLPFISYGGSFILSCFLMIGLIMNFSVDRRRS